MKIFVATKSVPKPDTASGDRRFFAILQILSAEHEVTLLIEDCEFSTEQKPYLKQLEQIGVCKIICGSSQMNWTMLTNNYDFALFEFFYVAETLMSNFQSFQPGIPIIIDSVDLNYLREDGAVKFGRMTPREATTNKQRELTVYAQATGVIVVTKEDEEALRKELPDVKTWLIPNIVPLLNRNEMPRKPVLLFVGGFKHDPNVDGILWFVNEVWPEIRRQIPESELMIVGSHPPPKITDLNGQAGIEVTGFVPDTAPYLDRAAVSIAPLLYGAGMKGKVSEALAAGLPVVTTSFGIQGFSAISGLHLLVADEPKEFAAHVVSLLNNSMEARMLGERGRELVKDLCSPQAVKVKVKQMLDEAANFRSSSNFKRILFCVQFCIAVLFRIAQRILRRKLSAGF